MRYIVTVPKAVTCWHRQHSTFQTNSLAMAKTVAASLARQPVSGRYAKVIDQTTGKTVHIHSTASR